MDEAPRCTAWVAHYRGEAARARISAIWPACIAKCNFFGTHGLRARLRYVTVPKYSLPLPPWPGARHHLQEFASASPQRRELYLFHRIAGPIAREFLPKFAAEHECRMHVPHSSE